MNTELRTNVNAMPDDEIDWHLRLLLISAAQPFPRSEFSGRSYLPSWPSAVKHLTACF